MLGVLLGWLARLWVATLRLRVETHPALEAAGARPWVLAFLHGRQFPLLGWRRRADTVVLVSLSRDGDLQARALVVQGLSVVRGSSSRGGVRGLATLVRRMRATSGDAAFAVDGPRGPYGEAKGGALAAAMATSAMLVPMGSAARPARVLARAWDRFLLPLPFARAAVVLGAPLAPDAPGARAALEAAIADANARAEAMVAR